MDCKVIDSGDGRLQIVTTIIMFRESLNKSLVDSDVAKKVLNRLVLHNTHTLRILVKDGLDIFCSPQGILRS
jgi:hypothetical protein